MKMPSPIDILYEQIYGNLPAKPGTAYERLATAAFKIMYPDFDVTHDAHLRGEISKSLYQIDVLAEKGGEAHAGEAKDYTRRGGKVGRPDIQKLGGGLPDLDVESGLFFSATEYTKPALQYAANSKKIVGKPISLFELREAVDKDLEGRIKTITLRAHCLTPRMDDAVFIPIFTQGGKESLARMEAQGSFANGQEGGCEKVFDENGNGIATIEELSSFGFGELYNGAAFASWVFCGGHIIISNELIHIHGISYKVPYNDDITELKINAEGRAVLLLKSADGADDKLIRDVDLKKFKQAE